ncbi:hypothetical protein KJ633_05970 [bacterium]|nr:hypothetical protein [bacterium]MBU4133990.1 hypothetical protein [bacterium]
MKKKYLSEVPVPSIIGVKTKAYGHFVALTKQAGKIYCIGDPLNGRLLLTESEFSDLYEFTGFVMHVKKREI